MSACRSCGASIVWTVTANGNAMPLDAQPVADGNIEMTSQVGVTRQGTEVPVVVVHGGGQQLSLVGVPPPAMYVSHFSTCPNADTHRKKR